MTILGYLFTACLIGFAGYNIYKLIKQIFAYKRLKSDDTKSDDKEV